ncbi:MAG TPA: tetratricopeptide repeat protein [Thermoanaerobaculia bacterium]|nr:tetratricopeptide repeat protein [Thermoanaerobaculia bacterium]
MDTIFRRFRNKQGEVWQLGWCRFPFWIAPEEGGRPFRPGTLVCLSLRTGRRRSSPVGAGEPGPEVFREVVAQAARAWRLRPERIEVTDSRIAEDLGALLSGEKVTVEARHDLPELRALLEEEAASIRDDAPPAALSAPGITVERMAAFARAAARFVEAAPWRHLDVDDPLVLEAADLPEELRQVQILGPVAVLFHPQQPEDGVDAKAEGFDSEDEEPDWEEEDWEMESWEDGWPPEEGLWKVSFVPPFALPPEDVELWLDQDLPLAYANAYPLVLRSFDGGTERPDARYLRWFEVVLDALASTTEEEMDTGRWEKEVVTSDGPMRLVLSLPEVLEPPYADSLPREEDDEVPEEMRLGFELATEAFGAFGRRQIHLARRAVALWPDCIEGWLVLARRAPDQESARNLYAEAVAAGERLMPGIEQREHPFDEEERLAFAPYCWARSGLARILWTLGAREEALNHFRWFLAMEPDDRKSAWYLAHALLALGRDEKAEDLLDRYADMEPDWLYVRALLTFRREGDSPAARRQMAAAIQGDRDLAKQLLEDVWQVESEEESPAVSFLDVWAETPGALEALRTQSAALAAVAKARKAKRKGEKKKRKRR